MQTRLCACFSRAGKVIVPETSGSFYFHLWRLPGDGGGSAAGRPADSFGLLGHNDVGPPPVVRSSYRMHVNTVWAFSGGQGLQSHTKGGIQ